MGGAPAPRSNLHAPALPQVPPGPSGAVQPLPLGRQGQGSGAPAWRPKAQYGWCDHPAFQDRNVTFTLFVPESGDRPSRPDASGSELAGPYYVADRRVCRPSLPAGRGPHLRPARRGGVPRVPPPPRSFFFPRPPAPLPSFPQLFLVLEDPIPVPP